ncbi:hypothetical protein [Oceanobacillus manasiensis]|uniref:hypothetical protein n=1 Tax=Oceanobacillus manasiensis TaxID=586413 RepID=UPI0005AA3717|nr:hypothetical protein [Oceanobacillus manasiensis]
MKKISLVGKINFVLGTILLLLGIYFFIQELSEGLTLIDFPLSIAFMLIGISIILSSFIYRKDV